MRLSSCSIQHHQAHYLLPPLVRALMDPSTSVRAEAYRTICYVTEPGDTRAMRLLVTHVEKGLGAVKTEVLDALTATAARGDLRVTMALATASEDPRPHLRCVALQCLARHVDFDQHRKTGLHQGLLQILLH